MGDNKSLALLFSSFHSALDSFVFFEHLIQYISTYLSAETQAIWSPSLHKKIKTSGILTEQEGKPILLPHLNSLHEPIGFYCSRCGDDWWLVLEPCGFDSRLEFSPLAAIGRRDSGQRNADFVCPTIKWNIIN